MATRLCETSALSSLIVVQGRKELSLSRAAEAGVTKGRYYALVALELGHEVAKVLDLTFLDLGSVAHQHRGENDHEVLGHVVQVKAVLLGGAVFFEQLVAQARIKLVPDELVLIRISQYNVLSWRQVQASALLTMDASISPGPIFSARLYSST